MKSALIGLTVVAVAVCCTFGASVYVSETGWTGGIDGPSPENAVVNKVMNPGESVTLHVWIRPDFVGRYVIDPDSSEAVKETDYLTAVGIDLKNVGSGSATATSNNVTNNAIRWSVIRGSGYVPVTTTISNAGHMNSNGLLWEDAGTAGWIFPPDGDRSYDRQGLGAAGFGALGIDNYQHSDGGALFGTITLTYQGGTVDIIGLVGAMTFANNLGTPEVIRFGNTMGVDGRVVGATNNAVLAHLIPEPVTLSLLSVGALTLISRRKMK